MFLSPDKTLADLQTDFSEQYPYLKIEFYDTSHKKTEYSKPISLLDNTLKIGEITHFDLSEKFELADDMTVGLFEQLVRQKYGLNIQVFRRSGTFWVQTGITDFMTLKEQNERGQSFGYRQAK